MVGGAVKIPWQYTDIVAIFSPTNYWSSISLRCQSIPETSSIYRSIFPNFLSLSSGSFQFDGEQISKFIGSLPVQWTAASKKNMEKGDSQ